MSSRTLHELESAIQQSREDLVLGTALERLLDNRDFKRLILDGYFKQEAIELVHLKSDPAEQSAESQKMISVQMDSIGCLKRYLEKVQSRREMAIKTIEDDEKTRDELMAEGLL